MKSIVSEKINARTLFYGATIFSILIFIIGFIPISNGEYFDAITLQLPFVMWACLALVGIMFIRKNWIDIAVCLAMTIPHIVAIAVMLASSYSIIDVLKWYFVIFSFGNITG